MTTEAGRRLLENLRYLDISWRDTDGSELNAAMVAAIEAEARAALLAELEAGVEGLADQWGPSDQDGYIRKKDVLDLIRKAKT